MNPRFTVEEKTLPVGKTVWKIKHSTAKNIGSFCGGCIEGSDVCMKGVMHEALRPHESVGCNCCCGSLKICALLVRLGNG